ncbi:MAG: hypothetical protein RL274_898 [Pseudomonadota bacterium]
MPREEKFFGLFNAHARILVDGAVALRDLLEGGPGVAEACARIIAHENAADAIARDVLLSVRRSFITPFDRGDIKDLIGQLDDSIDQMQKTAKAITRLEEQADDLNDQGIKALFLKSRDGNAMAFIVGNEIYDHLEKVVDRFEDVANRISGIVIEQI